MQSYIDRVAKFVSEQGLKIVETNVARRSIVVSGTVEQMSRAFAVELGHYQSPTETYRGREGFVYLPTDLAEIIEGVFGLDDRRVVRPLTVPAGAATLTPPQVAQLYNFPNQGNAAGQTIAILEFGGGFDVDRNGVATDIKAFFDGLGLSTPALTTVGIDGATNSPGSDINSDREVALDIDVCGSVAQGANLAVYFAPNSEQTSCAFGAPQGMKMRFRQTSRRRVSLWYKHRWRAIAWRSRYPVVTEIPLSRLTRAGKGTTLCRTRKREGRMTVSATDLRRSNRLR